MRSRANSTSTSGAVGGNSACRSTCRGARRSSRRCGGRCSRCPAAPPPAMAGSRGRSASPRRRGPWAPPWGAIRSASSSPATACSAPTTHRPAMRAGSSARSRCGGSRPRARRPSALPDRRDLAAVAAEPLAAVVDPHRLAAHRGIGELAPSRPGLLAHERDLAVALPTVLALHLVAADVAAPVEALRAALLRHTQVRPATRLLGRDAGPNALVAERETLVRQHLLHLLAHRGRHVRELLLHLGARGVQLRVVHLHLPQPRLDRTRLRPGGA